MAKQHGLEIFTVATHLQGQVLGDEPSAKTLNFCSGKGEAKAAYKAWRAAGNNPPRTDPYFVPVEVGKLVHAEAKEGGLTVDENRGDPKAVPLGPSGGGGLFSTVLSPGMHC